MFTNRAKALGATILGVVVVGALSYGQYQNTKEIANIKANPVVVTKTVVVTPTATPSAALNVTAAVKSGGIKIYIPASASKSAK